MVGGVDHPESVPWRQENRETRERAVAIVASARALLEQLDHAHSAGDERSLNQFYSRVPGTTPDPMPQQPLDRC